MKRSFTADRLAGVIAGAFLLRAADAVASVVGPLFLPIAGVGSRFLMVTPQLVTAIFAASLGIGYLLYSEKKWLHIGALVSLFLGGCILLAGALMPFFVRSEATDAVRSSMVSRAIAQELAIIFFVALVMMLMRKQKRPNQ